MNSQPELSHAINMDQPRLVICGGGTGGHFFSGLALAELFLKHYPKGLVDFVGTRHGIEAQYKFTDERMHIHFVEARGLKRKSILSKLMAVFSILFGIFESFHLLKTLKPTVVFGVGGYASAPPLVAALLLRRFLHYKVVLLEQNFVAGATNSYLKKYADGAYSGFQTPGFKLVDLPLRKAISRRAENASAPNWPPKTIFVLGGSQGAVGLNKKWMESLPHLKEKFPHIKIIHQVSRFDEKNVRATYKEMGIEAKVFVFSNDLAGFYEEADLVVCRAGAMTAFEVIAFKRPAIFVPFPYATEDHQLKNALAIQSREWIIAEENFSWERFGALLEASEPSIPRTKIEVTEKWPEILSAMLE